MCTKAIKSVQKDRDGENRIYGSGGKQMWN